MQLTFPKIFKYFHTFYESPLTISALLIPTTSQINQFHTPLCPNIFLLVPLQYYPPTRASILHVFSDITHSLAQLLITEVQVYSANRDKKSRRQPTVKIAYASLEGWHIRTVANSDKTARSTAVCNAIIHWQHCAYRY
jgi:hypothetical protein